MEHGEPEVRREGLSLKENNSPIDAGIASVVAARIVNKVKGNNRVSMIICRSRQATIEWE